MIFDLFLLLACLLLSAFFSGIEMGIISANRLRLLHIARTGNKRARQLADYLKDPDRLLSTILVGNNIVNQTLSTVAGVIALNFWGDAGLSVSTIVVTLVLLVFGEFLPKALFSSRPISRSLRFAPLLRFIEILLSPLSRLMILLSGLFVPTPKSSPATTKIVTREHLALLANNSESSGQISPLESLMISRALTLQTKTAAEIMTPISAVAALSPSGTLSDVSHLAATTNHNKFPVLDPDTHRCLGILYVQDVLARISGNPTDSVRDFMRRPFYVSAATRADDILPHLRRNRQRMAIVRDAHSHNLGIITIDAILNIIVGNLPRDTTGDRAADKDAAVLFNASGKEV